MSGKCRKCGRKLRTQKSRERGYGPECWKSISGGSSRLNHKQEEQIQIKGQMDINDWIETVGGERWNL